MSEWISVKDRLPEVKTKCLIYLHRRKEVAFATLENDNQWIEFPAVEFIESFCLDDSVTYWMPLPLPPKN